jgi:hypothetical protein
MTNAYQRWAASYPVAAASLLQALQGVAQPVTSPVGETEAWAQQQARFSVASQGALAWRNNVGATPTKCPSCGAKQQPIRYGLANDSTRLNREIKSGDLILAIPRLITPAMVGTTIAQFGSIESKRPGWHYTGKGQEAGQAAWAALVRGVGGYATFSAGKVEL